VLAGVIDPTKVTRTALQTAASIASLMLTTEAMIREISGEEVVSGRSVAHGPRWTTKTTSQPCTLSALLVRPCSVAIGFAH